MRTLALTREHALADLLESAAATITVDIIRRTAPAPTLVWSSGACTTALSPLEAGLDRGNVPGMLPSPDELLLAAKGTSPRSERMTSAQLLFRSAQRLEETIATLRNELKDYRAVA